MHGLDETDDRDRVYPLEWVDRTGGLPDIPGTPAELYDNLRALLIAIGSGTESSAEIRWPANELTRVSSAVRRATQSGLLTRQGSMIVPTAEGAAWRDHGDAAMLIAILHRNVRFLGELMAILAERPKSHSELLEVARKEYAFRWDTDAPVRKRTGWLRATGMVDLFDGKVHLTEAGSSLLKRLVLGGPRYVEVPASIEPLSGAVTEALHVLGVEELTGRNRRTQLYIPGGESGEARLDILRTLVEACRHPISANEFSRICKRVSRRPAFKSDVTVREGLQAMGLIERRRQDEWVATPLADVWLESGNPGDLAGVLHANLWYFAEILREMKRAGEVTVSHLVEDSASLSADGDGVIMARVRDRLQLLIMCGYVAKLTHRSYQISPQGLAFLDLVPYLSSRAEQTNEPRPTAGSAGVAGIRDVEPDAERIATELEDAARDGKNHERLEHAVVAALGYLGFRVEHIGGSGQPDGIVHTELGEYGERVLVETKAATNGVVSEGDAGYLSLERARRTHGIETTLLVGPGFEQVVLDRADEDGNVAVLLTGLLASVVRKHAISPLVPRQMGALFAPGLRHYERIHELDVEWANEERRREIVGRLVEVFLEEIDEPAEEHERFNVFAIRRSLRQRYGLRVEYDEILEALDFLASPHVGAIVAVPESQPRKPERKEDERNRAFRAAASRETVRRRVAALVNVL